jgi:hypothetical protein
VNITLVLLAANLFAKGLFYLVAPIGHNSIPLASQYVAMFSLHIKNLGLRIEILHRMT